MDSDTPAEDPNTAPARPWCLFRCGPAGFAIGLESVAEVVEVERLVRLPHSPPRVLGLCALRREVIPVIGLNEPGLDPVAATAGLVLILKTARGTWAVRINPEGTVVAEAGLDDPSSAGTDCGPAFLGTVRRGETTYAAIDPESTWQNVRRSVESWYCDRPGRDTSANTQSTLAANRAG